MVVSFILQKVPCMHCCPQCPQPCSRPLPTHTPPETPGHSRASLGQSLVGSLLLSPGSWSTQNSVCFLQESISQSCVSSGSWVNGDLLQEGLCHTQVYCTQMPCPCSSPLLTRTSAGDTQTQFCVSLCGVSGPWYAQGLFEPSECLWRIWGLILNVILPLLLSCWGFSFARGCGCLLWVVSKILLLTVVQQ